MMTPDDVVTASLDAFARGEIMCIPSLDDASQFERLAETQHGALLRAPALLVVDRSNNLPLFAGFWDCLQVAQRQC